MTTIRPKPKQTQIVTQLDTLEHEDIAALAFDHLITLLHKVSMNELSRMLRTTPLSITRWLDEDKPLTSISIMAASYIVLMCETNRKFIGHMQGPNRTNSYYGRG